MTADLHETVAARLRGLGQRYTAGRRALVDILAAASQPLATPDVVAAGQGLAQSSVYRNLAVLEQAGVIHRIVTSDEFSRCELAEDLTEHHHHLICSGCGAVEDFTASPQFERTVARAVDAVADRTGFSIEHHRLDLIGTCVTCG